MNRNEIGMKRKIFVDGQELPGLVETGPMNDEEGVVEVPGFGRKVEIKDGVKKFGALDATYKVQPDTITKQFFRDWYYKNEVHDVVVVNTDATGVDVDKWLLPDCECAQYNEREFNAGSVTWFGLVVKITCSGTPTTLDA